MFLITALGFVFGRFKKINLSAINEFVIYAATPALILSSLADDPIDISLAGKVFTAVVIIIGIASVIGYLIIKNRGLSNRVFLPPVLFANTGNMGLPLVFFAFGERGFDIGILYMVSTTFIHYTYGIWILNASRNPVEILKLPLIYATVAGVAISVSGWEMPVYVARGVDLLGEASIPTMIFALGYKLSEIKLHHIARSIFFGGLRIGLGLMLGVLVVMALKIDGLAAKVVILQAAMPPAIFNFVLADKFKQDSREVASIILAGTLISLVTTPLILAYLLE